MYKYVLPRTDLAVPGGGGAGEALRRARLAVRHVLDVVEPERAGAERVVLVAFRSVCWREGGEEIVLSIQN